MRYEITAPEAGFSGEVAGVVFTRGVATLDTATPGGVAALSYFQRKPYTVDPVSREPEVTQDAEPNGDEPYDPAVHNADEVMAYLAVADEAEARRVLDAEVAGKARKGITSQRDAILASKKENDQ